jgi:hypothetical protein
VHQWTVDDVCAFFAAQKLGEYIAAIQENGVDGCLLLKTAELHALGYLGITNAFHVIKIEDGLAKIAENLLDGSVAEAVVRLRVAAVRLPCFLDAVPCSSRSARPSTTARRAPRRMPARRSLSMQRASRTKTHRLIRPAAATTDATTGGAVGHRRGETAAATSGGRHRGEAGAMRSNAALPDARRIGAHALATGGTAAVVRVRSALAPAPGAAR